MARGLNIVFLAAIAIAALIQTSLAQTTHTVGDTTGWAIPTGDLAFYSSWAANQTFNVGEILGNTTTLINVCFFFYYINQREQYETGFFSHINILFLIFFQCLILWPTHMMLPR